MFKANVNNIVFHAKESGFYILNLTNVTGDISFSNVTAKGHGFDVKVGDIITSDTHQLDYYNSQPQISCEAFNVSLPTTQKDLKKYLIRQKIKGFGERTIKLCLDQFGLDFLDVVERHPERIKDLNGIGSKTLTNIVDGLSESLASRATWLFLSKFDLGSGVVNRIVKQYGVEAVDIVQDDPYTLAYDISGVSFKSCDLIAQSIGIPMESSKRVSAALHFVLSSCDGDTCLEFNLLHQRVSKLLSFQVSAKLFKESLERLRETNIIETSLQNGLCFVYLFENYNSEINLCEHIHRISNYTQKQVTERQIELAISDCMDEFKIETLTVSQALAVRNIAKEKFSLLVGGPGTGKTFVINLAIQMLIKLGLINYKRIKVVAPTGKAAQRAKISSGMDSSTIHRLLGYNSNHSDFEYHEDNPLDVDLLVVDEVSMLDNTLGAKLFAAIPDHTIVVLVGDPDQLPSVQAGAILRDMIDSGVLTVNELKDPRRYSEHSQINLIAQAIKYSTPINITNHPDSDIFFTEQPDSESVTQATLSLITRSINKFAVTLDDIQILTPVKSNNNSTTHLNKLIQEQYNSHIKTSQGVQSGKYTLYEKDRVILVKNKHDDGLYNGDIGFVSNVNAKNRIVTVRFDNGISHEFKGKHLKELELSYAMTVHKSQGSEFPIVICVVSSEHQFTLNKENIYTGLTRAKRAAIFVGQSKTFQTVIKKRGNMRSTLLKQRLVSYCGD